MNGKRDFLREISAQGKKRESEGRAQSKGKQWRVRERQGNHPKESAREHAEKQSKRKQNRTRERREKQGKPRESQKKAGIASHAGLASLASRAGGKEGQARESKRK